MMMTVIEMIGYGPLQLVLCSMLVKMHGTARHNQCMHSYGCAAVPASYASLAFTRFPSLHESVVGWFVGAIVEAVVDAVRGAAVGAVLTGLALVRCARVCAAICVHFFTSLHL